VGWRTREKKASENEKKQRDPKYTQTTFLRIRGSLKKRGRRKESQKIEQRRTRKKGGISSGIQEKEEVTGTQKGKTIAREKRLHLVYWTIETKRFWVWREIGGGKNR